MEILESGWCWRWNACRGVGVECVRACGVEQCRGCWARELGLPADIAAGAVVAELMRRGEVAA